MLLEPTALKLKTQLLGVTNILGHEARLQELDQIASALIAAYNETEAALSSKIGGTGHRSFGGSGTVTGNASNQGLATVSFSHDLPSASYEVYLAPLETGSTNPGDTTPILMGYTNRQVGSFQVEVETLLNGDTINFFWFVVY